MTKDIRLQMHRRTHSNINAKSTYGINWRNSLDLYCTV